LLDSKSHRECNSIRKTPFRAAMMIFAAAVSGCSPSESGDSPLAKVAGGESFAMERAKAQRNPYANDFGSPVVDVSGYPLEMQTTYKELFLVKCQRCHSASRALNSQYLEPSGAKEEEQAKVATWKKEQPELFTDRLVWEVGAAEGSKPGIWEQYVKRMMAKPGCNIQPAEAKLIWEFLRYDSERRKTGANAAAWAQHRRTLLTNFKGSHPDRYRELYETE
jgi:hypothetical protein